MVAYGEGAAMSRRDERGASAVEYGLLVVGVAAALIFTLQVLGAGLSAVFEQTNTNLGVPSSTP